MGKEKYFVRNVVYLKREISHSSSNPQVDQTTNTFLHEILSRTQ